MGAKKGHKVIKSGEFAFRKEGGRSAPRKQYTSGGPAAMGTSLDRASTGGESRFGTGEGSQHQTGELFGVTAKKSLWR